MGQTGLSVDGSSNSGVASAFSFSFLARGLRGFFSFFSLGSSLGVSLAALDLSLIHILSSSRALRDVTRAHGCEYNAAAVGEVNVVAKMKATNAVIGGEGNGGVIYPASHYGRDALVGIALFLTHLAKKKMKTSELKASYPPYFISKQKVQLTPEIDVDAILAKVKEKFSQYDITDIDGVKIDFPDKWVHLRKSNTEPIIRISVSYTHLCV